MDPGVPAPGTLRFPRSWLAPLASAGPALPATCSAWEGRVDPDRAKPTRFAAPCVPPRMFSCSCRSARKLIEKMHALDEAGRGAKSTYSKRISRCSVFSQNTLPDPRMSHGSSILAKCEVLGRPKSATKPTNEMSLTLTTALGFLVLNACSLGRHAALGDLRSN